MHVKIEKTFQVDAPIEQAWTFLSNPSRVVTCVPGANITEQVDDRTYKGAVSMKIGPVKTDFKGDITIDRLDDQAHELELTGQGADMKGKGNATMTMTGRLRTLDDGRTEVESTMEINVVGRLAQFGARLMQDVSNRMFDQFTDCFEQNMQSTDAQAEGAATGEAGAATSPENEPIDAVPLVADAVWSSVKRKLGKKDKEE